MEQLKICSFAECPDVIGLTREAWTRVRSFPAEEREAAMHREFTWPEGFLEHLKGKTLEEQMACYRIVEDHHYSRTAYGEITNENKNRFGYALENYSGLKGLIVDDGVLIGVLIRTYNYFSYPDGMAAFPYQDICTYYASDDNGSGSKDREDYAHLCCVMPENK